MDSFASEKGVPERYMDERPRGRDVFLFSHPRTASNLFTRLLSDQPGWAQSEYHFQDAFQFARNSFTLDETSGSTLELRQQFDSLFQRGFMRLCQERDAAIAESKCLFVKNHTFHLWEPSEIHQRFPRGSSAPSLVPPPSSSISSACINPTLLPDSFLTSWQPIFLIRHPALVFESWYRAEMGAEPINILDSSWACFMTFRYSRQLHDWFMSSRENDKQGSEVTTSFKPIVIDADDIIEGESMISNLCRLCNMDPQSICREWEVTKPPNDVNYSRRHLSYMSGLWESTSIDKSKMWQGSHMTARYAQWKDEFGITAADALLAHVENAMPDYEYLRAKKM